MKRRSQQPTQATRLYIVQRQLPALGILPGDVITWNPITDCARIHRSVSVAAVLQAVDDGALTVRQEVAS